LNRKVERSHRTDHEEFYRMLEGVVIDDTELLNDRLQERERFYNFNRPHGSLGGQTMITDARYGVAHREDLARARIPSPDKAEG
jgi:transposase InsO family protein